MCLMLPLNINLTLSNKFLSFKSIYYLVSPQVFNFMSNYVIDMFEIFLTINLPIRYKIEIYLTHNLKFKNILRYSLKFLQDGGLNLRLLGSTKHMPIALSQAHFGKYSLKLNRCKTKNSKMC